MLFNMLSRTEWIIITQQVLIIKVFFFAFLWSFITFNPFFLNRQMLALKINYKNLIKSVPYISNIL